ncbi:MAG: mitochondrial escape protein 2 [Peltula sp. TS41687]|nr:MAG: mitochondrial escape protein 2 [Peltula sp. TS41687]
MFTLGRQCRVSCSGIRSAVTQRHHDVLAEQYRTRRNPDRIAIGKRLNSSDAGLPETGHIEAAPNEGILWFDHVFPLKLQWLLRSPWQAEKSLRDLMSRFDNPTVALADPLNIIKQALPSHLSLKVTEIVPRFKEGGAFVKFSHPDGLSDEEIEVAVKDLLKKETVKPWFNPFHSVSVALVRGRPWLEDLYRLPSSRLKVEFVPTASGGQAPELSQEELYSFFRRYGKIADIATQPPDSKVLPRYALLDFARVRHAIMARNCMHGFKVGGGAGEGAVETVLRIGYERKIKVHWIRDWIFNHPRLVIPAVAAILATITVAIFDPIRTFFIKAHIEETFHITSSRIYRWFEGRATDIFRFRHGDVEGAGLRALWDDRKENIQQVRTWLMETAETFIVVQGPRGSAKRELVVDEALKDRKYKLLIDCKPIQEARGDSATIRAAAAEVGYRPVFSWMNSFSSLIDLAAQGTIGTKAGFSETLDTQLAKILQTTATALKQVALEDRKKKDKDATLTDDEYLEAHPEKRLVVVVDNFLHKTQESSLVYDKIAEWAAGLTVSNVAHVIFLTTDVSFSKSLSKALPDRVFRQISLGDCSPGVAKRIVISHLDADADDAGSDAEKLTPSQRRKDLGELDECIGALGGRLTDLEFLARRMKTGESPSKAVQHIIEQSASEILKMYLLDAERSQRQWTPQQAWLLVKQLATTECLRYNEILLSDTFKSGGEVVLQALEQAELISIHSINGRPHSIRPGKPVYASAFRLLTEDHVLKSRLDLSTLNELIKIENTSIDKYEAELVRLSSIPEPGNGLRERIRWLIAKLMKSQRDVEEYEAECAGLKKVLLREY